MRKTAIIVPCYNEAKRIQKTEFLVFCDRHTYVSFIFVNDGSTDDTELILLEMQENSGRQVSLLNLPSNLGKAEAVRQGVLNALSDDYDYIGYWDADLATPLSNILVFIDELNRLDSRDIVMGSRVRLLGRTINRQSLRHYLGRLFATFTSIILSLPVYDTQCGAKLFRNTPVVEQIFADPFKTKWIFDVEILARYLTQCGENRNRIIAEKILESPLETWKEISGSKLGVRDYFISSLGLVLIWFHYRKEIV